MFIDENSSHQVGAPEAAPAAPPSAAPISPPWYARKKNLTIFGSIAAALLVIGGIWLWAVMRPPVDPNPPLDPENPGGVLPQTLDPNGNTAGNGSENGIDVKAETVFFGDYYEPFDEPLELELRPVALPLNVKTDVSNYHDLARKINLDPVIENLNRDGFAVLENPFVGATDFFSIYRELDNRVVPTLVTADFLLYYYQSALKHTYKEVEASFFYESLWKLNHALFERANARYLGRLNEVGLSNDPLLEASRLEAAYFAAALALLTPTEDQIDPAEDLNDSRKFRLSEARRYSFEIPPYLQTDLAQELALVRVADATAKSPLLLYRRDYKDFAVPEEYRDTAKLRNAYAAIRWQASLFPLAYRDDACPECLLDREDWLINQTAAYLIAADISADQALKNEWAKIYKVISFFTGLRSDLTYLHYEQSRLEAFPEETVEEVFAADVANRLLALRERLLDHEFNRAEGALPRPADLPRVGMRLLQTSYSPSNYIFSRLTFDPVGPHNRPNPPAGASYLTGCRDSEGTIFRCRGIGYDVLGLVAEQMPDSDFLRDNMDYRRYAEQREQLRLDLSRFTVHTWYSNNFWTTLSLVAALVNGEELFPYERNTRWQERIASTALAALTHGALPADQWETDRERTNGLGTASGSNALAYVEPQLALVDELAASATMIHRTLATLGVVRENDPGLTEIRTQLLSLRSIMRKELSGETLAPADYQLIGDVLDRFKVVSAGTKIAAREFSNLPNRSYGITQSIEPVRLLVLIYERDGAKVLAVGPIFNYKEIE